MAEIKDPENTLILETTKGNIVIELLPDLAPLHVARIKELTREGAYNNVVFHRVIDGFMAQTGDVEFGKKDGKKFNPSRAGMGGSDKPDLKAEFSNIPHKRGTLSMARSQNPNSGNSQFFICFEDAPWLDRQYTVWGQVVEGMDNVDKIKRGEPVSDPDSILKATIAADVKTASKKATTSKEAVKKDTAGVASDKEKAPVKKAPVKKTTTKKTSAKKTTDK